MVHLTIVVTFLSIAAYLPSLLDFVADQTSSFNKSRISNSSFPSDFQCRARSSTDFKGKYFDTPGALGSLCGLIEPVDHQDLAPVDLDLAPVDLITPILSQLFILIISFVASLVFKEIKVILDNLRLWSLSVCNKVADCSEALLVKFRLFSPLSGWYMMSDFCLRPLATLKLWVGMITLYNRCSYRDIPFNWNSEKKIRWIAHAYLLIKKDKNHGNNAARSGIEEELRTTIEEKLNTISEVRRSYGFFPFLCPEICHESRYECANIIRNAADHALENKNDDSDCVPFEIQCQKLLYQHPDIFHVSLIVMARYIPANHPLWSLENGGYRVVYELFHDSEISCFARPPRPSLLVRLVKLLFLAISLCPPDLPPNWENDASAQSGWQEQPQNDILSTILLLLSLGSLLLFVSDECFGIYCAFVRLVNLISVCISFVPQEYPDLPPLLLLQNPIPPPLPPQLHLNHFDWDVEKIGRYLIRFSDLICNKKTRKRLTEAMNENQVTIPPGFNVRYPILIRRTTTEKLRRIRNMLVHWYERYLHNRVPQFGTYAELCERVLDHYPDLFVLCQIVAASELPADHIFWTIEGDDYRAIYEFHHRGGGGGGGAVPVVVPLIAPPQPFAPPPPAPPAVAVGPPTPEGALPSGERSEQP